jgi:hypothetical protein
MRTRECYHCKQLIEEGAPHDCWTTTETALTRDLPEDLQDAYERLRESAVSLGEQRVYASHNSIMFARKSCYFFVRPKKSFLEVCFFLERAVNAPQIRRVDRSSSTKLAHVVQVRHRDQVEAPLTDWLQEAYGLQERLEKARVTGSNARKSASKGTNTRARQTRPVTSNRRAAPRGRAASRAKRPKSGY